MKIFTALFTLSIVFSSCNTDKDNDPVPCTCDEIVEMQVVIQGQPSPTYEINVDYCDINGAVWEQISQTQYDTLNVGDCL